MDQLNSPSHSSTARGSASDTTRTTTSRRFWAACWHIHILIDTCTHLHDYAHPATHHFTFMYIRRLLHMHKLIKRGLISMRHLSSYSLASHQVLSLELCRCWMVALKNTGRVSNRRPVAPTDSSNDSTWWDARLYNDKCLILASSSPWRRSEHSDRNVGKTNLSFTRWNQRTQPFSCTNYTVTETLRHMHTYACIHQSTYTHVCHSTCTQLCRHHCICTHMHTKSTHAYIPP